MILGLKGLTKEGICKDLGSKEPTKFQILEDMGFMKTHESSGRDFIIL